MVYRRRRTLDTIQRMFSRELVAYVVTDGNKEIVPTSRVSGKVTDDETKGALSSNSLYSLLTGVDNERSAFPKTLKLEVLLVKRGRQTNFCT